MKYYMPGLAPTDVSWRTHNTSKQFPARHVKSSNIICINFAVPSCKATTDSTTTLKICGRDAIKTILSQRMYVWTWNASAAFLQSVVNIVLLSDGIIRGQHTAQPVIGLDTSYVARKPWRLTCGSHPNVHWCPCLVWIHQLQQPNYKKKTTSQTNRKPRHKASQFTQSNASYTFELRIHNGLFANNIQQCCTDLHLADDCNLRKGPAGSPWWCVHAQFWKHVEQCFFANDGICPVYQG